MRASHWSVLASTFVVLFSSASPAYAQRAGSAYDGAAAYEEARREAEREEAEHPELGQTVSAHTALDLVGAEVPLRAASDPPFHAVVQGGSDVFLVYVAAGGWGRVLEGAASKVLPHESVIVNAKGVPWVVRIVPSDAGIAAGLARVPPGQRRSSWTIGGQTLGAQPGDCPFGQFALVRATMDDAGRDTRWAITCVGGDVADRWRADARAAHEAGSEWRRSHGTAFVPPFPEPTTRIDRLRDFGQKATPRLTLEPPPDP